MARGNAPQTPQERAVEIGKMLNIKDKKSLGSVLLYVHDRWEEEKHVEDFEIYANWMRNVLRKFTPRRTKFVELTKEPIAVTIRLHNAPKAHKISVANKRLTVVECD